MVSNIYNFGDAQGKLTRIPMEEIAHSASVLAAPVAVLTRPPGTGRALTCCSLNCADRSGPTVSG